MKLEEDNLMKWTDDEIFAMFKKLAKKVARSEKKFEENLTVLSLANMFEDYYTFELMVQKIHSRYSGVGTPLSFTGFYGTILETEKLMDERVKQVCGWNPCSLQKAYEALEHEFPGRFN